MSARTLRKHFASNAMTDQPLSKKTVNILGKSMAYHELGEGTPVLFLHGNPTSSYLWRDVIPELHGYGRLIAPDLIGMGDSDKLVNPGPTTYTFSTHRDHLWAFIDAVIGSVDKVVLVIHDWGSALGFEWANHHRERVSGIAYMSDKGESLILDRNLFIERVLPGSVMRRLSEAEMTEYRKPFLNREDRWPTLTWPRQIPIAGEPVDVTSIVEAYASWMSENQIPKLFINANPGAILTGPLREYCRSWKNQTEATVPGTHFIQEDSGATIGRLIGVWMQRHILKQPPAQQIA
jgi:haloalkane dehalogenase